jgi:hypothetical protein
VGRSRRRFELRDRAGFDLELLCQGTEHTQDPWSPSQLLVANRSGGSSRRFGHRPLVVLASCRLRQPCIMSDSDLQNALKRTEAPGRGRAARSARKRLFSPQSWNVDVTKRTGQSTRSVAKGSQIRRRRKRCAIGTHSLLSAYSTTG